MTKKQKRLLIRIFLSLTAFIAVSLVPTSTIIPGPGALYLEFALFLIPYLIIGYDVLLRAGKNIARGQVFDENFLMSIATIGAFALVLFPDAEQHFSEGTAVMLFYQVGELFQSYAVGKSRKSIADMMDIAPDFANIERDGAIIQVDPYDVAVGDTIVVKAGERVPLDGTVLTGSTQLNTSALTGEAVPRNAKVGDEVISGCVNLTGLITVQVSKPFGESTVSRILELVEHASEKKARTESFITRFARYYTPIVVIIAALLAVIPPVFFGQEWADWIQRGLVFLVVSCPCALVISVPLSFFGGIGGASRLGILVKGSNYLETLGQTETVVFDKTGTLTSGTFDVVAIKPESSITSDQLLSLAAHAEAFSNHPIALSVRKAFEGELDCARIEDVEEQSGLGIKARIDNERVLVGNDKLMKAYGISHSPCLQSGTILYLASNATYLGYLVISDVIKPDAVQAIAALRAVGIKKTVMLTGDREEVAAATAQALGIDEYHAHLLPQDKVAQVERLLSETSEKGKLAFVGDGINDAPVLTRADVGIAMGAMGSDAAIEAADIVLMDDKPSNIAKAVGIARKTMSIVRQNIVFALGIKFLVLILAAFGIANMWLAVFADVGVSVIAILNAMRAMSVKK